MTTVVTDVSILLNTVVEQQVLTVGEAGPAGAGTAAIADALLFANISGGSAVPSGHTLTAVLDALAGSTSGMILRRGTAVWAAEQLGLTITAGQTLTVTTGGTIGSAAYTDANAYEAAGGIAAHAAVQTGVHGLAITTGKTETFLKTMSFTAEDDTGVYTFPTGTKTLAATDVATLSSLTTVGALNAGSITSGFGSIDVGVNAISGGAISGRGATLSSGGYTLTGPPEAISLGADFDGYVRTNSINKIGLITIPHYLNAQPGMLLIDGYTQSGSNTIDIGGGLTAYNVATAINFFTGATTTTTIGINRLSISSAGATTASGILSTTDATDATSATAASLKTAGGIAAVKGLWVGTNFVVAGSGPHAIGGATNSTIYIGILGSSAASSGLRVGMTLTGTNAQRGFQVSPTLNPAANVDASLASIGEFSTINEAASGTHADFAALKLSAPTITGAAAALTRASTLYITGAPTGAATNAAIYVAAGNNIYGGNSRFGGTTAPTVALDVTGAALISTTLGVAGVLSVTDATDATSTTAASSKTAGGFSAVKQIIAGTAVLGNFLTAIPAGGATTCGFKSTSTANFGVFFGSGAPTLSAARGSLYLRSNGTTTNDRAYINTDGGTIWTALTTAA